MSERLDTYVRAIGRRLHTSLGGMHALDGCASGWTAKGDKEDLGHGYMPKCQGFRVTPSTNLGWLLHSLGTAYTPLLDFVMLWTACSLVFENQMSPAHAAAHTRSLLARRLGTDCVHLFVAHRYPHQSLELAVAQELRIPFFWLDQHVRPMVVFPPMYDELGRIDHVGRELRYSPFDGKMLWGMCHEFNRRAETQKAFLPLSLQLYAFRKGDKALFAALSLLSKLHLQIAKALWHNLHVNDNRVVLWNFTYEAESPYSKCCTLLTYARGEVRDQAIRRRFAGLQNIAGAANFLLPHN